MLVCLIETLKTNKQKSQTSSCLGINSLPKADKCGSSLQQVPLNLMQVSSTYKLVKLYLNKPVHSLVGSAATR